jgi:Raf kinase inhibitor-like YbhB/YbcL family protein
MVLSSPVLRDMEPLPLRYAQYPYRNGTPGRPFNPPLEWSNVPPGTNAFVLTLSDTGGRPYDTLMWTVVNIPGNVRSLPEDIPNGNTSGKLPAGAFHKSHRTNGWIGSGAGTAPEGVMRYIWKLYPLDQRINVTEDANREDIMRAMEGHLTGNKAIFITPCCYGSK